jgi:hypothetical protein
LILATSNDGSPSDVWSCVRIFWLAVDGTDSSGYEMSGTKNSSF